jgi:hypothetical protein
LPKCARQTFDGSFGGFTRAKNKKTVDLGMNHCAALVTAYTPAALFPQSDYLPMPHYVTAILGMDEKA